VPIPGLEAEGVTMRFPTRQLATAILSASASALCLAGQAGPGLDPTSGVPRSVLDSIDSVLPQEAGPVRAVGAALDSKQTLETVTRVVSRTGALMRKKDLPPHYSDDVTDAHNAAWELVAFVHRRSQNQQQRTALRSLWDSYLEDNAITCYQVGALDSEWDRRLLTPKYWALFRSTKSVRLVASMGSVVANHGLAAWYVDGKRVLLTDRKVAMEGVAEDEARIRERLQSETDPAIREVLGIALWWLRYRSSDGELSEPPSTLIPF
jgi:hypothetical protein